MAFSKQQIKDFTRKAKAQYGADGWKMLIVDVQRDVIAAQAFSVIRGQAAELVSVEACNALYTAMLEEAGLS